MVEQNQIDLENLKILDDKKYTKSYVEEKRVKYLGISLIIYFVIMLVVIVLSTLFADFTASNNFLLLIFGVLVLSLLYLLTGNLILYMVGNNLKFLFISIIVVDIIISAAIWWGLGYIKTGNWVYDNIILNCFVWITSFITILIHIVTYFICVPPYYNRSISEILQLVITYLSIPTMVYGVDIFKPANFLELAWGSFVMILTVSLTFLSIYVDYRISRTEQRAQVIFKEQLKLSIQQSSQIKYEKLKECYYYGGETYRDKMLSNEKMIRKILNKEDK